jgi:site-specific DNA-methyltransferase (adenine-specific)
VSKSIEGLLTTGSANKTAFKNLAGEQVDRGDWGIAKQQFTHGQRDTNYDETASATRLGKLEPTTAEAKEWDGWGTALKPAHEPIVLARKPLVGTVANNVLTYGTGGINIDGSRVGEGTGESKTVQYPDIRGNNYNNASGTVEYTVTSQGRFPANLIHDGSDEVLELFPSVKANESAARFFYCAKASKKDRNEGLDQFPEVSVGSLNMRTDSHAERNGETTAPAKNHHPTVKPTDLMRYLCRLITPPNGTVLDPFTGSGSTGKAAVLEGFSFIGVEQSEEYIAIAEARIKSVYDSGA